MKSGVTPSQLRTWLVRPAIALAVVVAVLALAAAVRDASAGRLADGSRLRVWGFQRGTPAHLDIRETYGRKPYTWIPVGIRQRLGLVPAQLDAGTGRPDDDAVVVWFTRFDPRRDGYRWRLFSRIEVMDDSGNATDEAAQSPFSAAEIKGGVIWVRHPPSDGRGFRLRLHGGTPVRVLGEIEVPPAPLTSSSRRTASPGR